jgi:hypothetical protein
VVLLEYLALDCLNLADDGEVAEDVVGLFHEPGLGVNIHNRPVCLGDEGFIGRGVCCPYFLGEAGKFLAGGELSRCLGMSEE